MSSAKLRARSEAVRHEVLATLKNAREAQGVSNNRLAELTGLSRKALWKLELPADGKQADSPPNLTVETLVTVCQALGLNAWEVLREAMEKHPVDEA